MVYVEKKLFFSLAEITNVHSKHYQGILTGFLPKIEQIINENEGGKDYVQKNCPILLKRGKTEKEIKALVLCFPPDTSIHSIEEFTENVIKFYSACIISKKANDMLELQNFPFNDIIDDNQFVYYNTELFEQPVLKLFLMLTKEGSILNYYNVNLQ